MIFFKNVAALLVFILFCVLVIPAQLMKGCAWMMDNWFQETKVFKATVSIANWLTGNY